MRVIHYTVVLLADGGCNNAKLKRHNQVKSIIDFIFWLLNVHA